MEEIKRRVNVVIRVLNDDTNTGFLITNAELIAIQLRKIAELIALSTISSHRDEYERIRDNFERDWNPRLILRDVARLNPNFYPKPTRQIKDPDSNKVVETVDIKDGYLTQSELVRMVESCSAILHAFNPYQETQPKLDDFLDQSKTWVDEIITLLSHHQVQLLDSDSQWWVLMRTKSDPRVHIFQMRKAGKARKGEE